MSRSLTIDQGNSAAKVAVWQGDTLVSLQLCNPLSQAHIESLAREHDLTAGIYCSVAASSEAPLRWMRQCGLRAMELTHSTALPITIGYTTPQTLGRDRIAAAVGAFGRHPGSHLLVVDVGTAVTYDVVTPNGEFIGGNIAPGPWMRLQSLHHFTSRLPKVDAEGPLQPWGVDTPGAMRSGAVLGVAAEIAYYRSHLPEGTEVVVTGGDAHLALPHLNFPTDYQPNLVSEGLNRILRFNEPL